MKKNNIIGPKAIVYLSKCRKNLLAIKNKIGHKKLLCVVKANGYGHGAIQIAKSISDIDNVQFAVFSFDEAIELRNANIKNDILIFSKLQSSNIESAYKYDLILNISSIDDISSAERFFKKNKISPRYHIKFDTGMTRLGFDLKDAEEVYNKISGEISYYVEGIYTHFATADEGELSFAEKQLKDFNKIVKKADEFGLSFKHIPVSYTHLTLPTNREV